MNYVDEIGLVVGVPVRFDKFEIISYTKLKCYEKMGEILSLPNMVIIKNVSHPLNLNVSNKML